MSSFVKWILGGIGFLLALIIIVMVSLPLIIDPNDYKNKIAQAVEKQTGRELVIPGDIKLSISPTLKVIFKLGDVSISSNKAFQSTDFLSSKMVEINLALWPLLKSKTLQIDHIGLEGVNVNLVRNMAGKTNWQNLTGGDKNPLAPRQPQTAKKEPVAVKPAKPLPKIDIGGITIADTNVTYSDLQAGKTVKLSNFNLNAGHIMENKPFPVKADFAILIDDGKQPLRASTKLTTDLTFDIEKLVVVLGKLSMKTDIAGAPIPVRSFGLDMNAKADLETSRIDVSTIEIRIDDTTAKGTASIINLKKPAYTTKLHIDQLNLDRYIPEKKGVPASTTPAVVATPPATAKQSKLTGTHSPQPQAPSAEDAPIIPVDLLRGLTFDAEVKIDKLIAAKLVTTNILVIATGNNGLVELKPFSADLYDGTVTVNGDIDARPNVPTMKLTKILKDVEMGPMFMDLKGKEEVKGKADILVAVTTKGNTKKELTRNANGTLKLALANGEIAKLKIIDTIRVAKRLYEGKSGESSQTAKKDAVKSGRPTQFADLSATGIITNGVITNEDLLAQSELMRVTGKGKINLNTEEIDYLLTIYLARKLERAEDKGLVEMSDTPIPYKVTGTFDKIDQKAALGEVLKAGAVKLLSKELEKRLKDDSGEQGKEGKESSNSTEELINKGLKSLFGN